MSEVYYECQRCGACCRWPGQVRLTEAEISSLARFLALSEPEFIERFTRLQENRQGLSLIDNLAGECIFFKDNGCAVNPVKPQQCIDFPNKWNFPGFQKHCKALVREKVDSAEQAQPTKLQDV